MEPRTPGKLEAFLTLVTMLIASWYMMPPQQRYWIQLRSLQQLHRVSARLAWRAGHKGMGDELAGRDLQRYPLAYLLSRARDQLALTLEDMRP